MTFQLFSGRIRFPFWPLTPLSFAQIPMVCPIYSKSIVLSVSPCLYHWFGFYCRSHEWFFGRQQLAAHKMNGCPPVVPASVLAIFRQKKDSYQRGQSTKATPKSNNWRVKHLKIVAFTSFRIDNDFRWALNNLLCIGVECSMHHCRRSSTQKTLPISMPRQQIEYFPYFHSIVSVAGTTQNHSILFFTVASVGRFGWRQLYSKELRNWGTEDRCAKRVFQKQINLQRQVTAAKPSQRISEAFNLLLCGFQ